jgi:hypothetical protein
MADRVPLVDLPDDATFQVTGRKITTTPDGATSVEFIREDTGEAVGGLSIGADGAISGTLTDSPQVEPLAIAIQVGDVMRNERDGRVVVAMSIGLPPDGRGWSYSANHRPNLAPEGWAKIGHIDPDTL